MIKKKEALLRQSKMPKNQYSMAVMRSLTLSMEAIKQDQPVAITILHLCAFLDVNRIPNDLFEKWLEKQEESVRKLDFNGEILWWLSKYALVDSL